MLDLILNNPKPLKAGAVFKSFNPLDALQNPVGCQVSQSTYQTAAVQSCAGRVKGAGHTYLLNQPQRHQGSEVLQAQHLQQNTHRWEMFRETDTAM